MASEWSYVLGFVMGGLHVVVGIYIGAKLK